MRFEPRPSSAPRRPLQLLQWQKKRGQGAAKGRLVRMAPQSAAAPQYLVPRSVRGGSPACLDPRGSFVLHTESGVDVWLVRRAGALLGRMAACMVPGPPTGEHRSDLHADLSPTTPCLQGGACPPPFAEAALRYAGQLSKYEGAPATPRIQEQGAENEAFWTALGDAGAGAARDTRIQRVAAYDQDFEVGEGGSGRNGTDGRPHSATDGCSRPLLPPPSPRVAVARSRLCSHPLTGPPAAPRAHARTQLFARLDLGPAATSDSDASPRSARKTPREDAGGDGPSPNERLRKLARGTVPGSRHQQPAAQARAGGEPGTAQQGPGQDVPPAGAGGPLRERQQNDGDSLAAKSPAHRARAVKEGEPRRVAAASPRRAAEAQ